MTKDKTSEDKLIDEYLSGRLPFSEIYKKLTKDEQCPDDLSTSILAMAARPERPGLVQWIATRFTRKMRIVLAVVLLTLVAAALIVAISIPPRTTSLECPGNPAAEKNGPDPTSETRALRR